MLFAQAMRSRLQFTTNEMDEEFQRFSNLINQGKDSFPANEQSIIDSWLDKLSQGSDTTEKKIIRNEYVRALAYSINKKKLWAPFNQSPPEGELTPLADKKRSQYMKQQLDTRSRSTSKGRKNCRNLSPDDDLNINKFEDPEEMAKVLVRSKGQSLAEFISAISRYTADYGQELFKAMKLETTCFREYVDKILSQRIQDLTDILNEEQNRELQKIKKDVDKWNIELSLVKGRIEEMIPEFDLDEYRRDKNYLKKMFQIKPEISEEDAYQKWNEESTQRLKWTTDRIFKVKKAIEETTQEISNVKFETAKLEAQDSARQKGYLSQFNSELSDYKALLSEREKLLKGNSELLNQLKSMCR